MNLIYYILLLLPFIIGMLLGLIYKDTWNDSYIYLLKSRFVLPNYVFSIVWPILYILIGISYANILPNNKIIYWILPIIALIFNFIYIPSFTIKKYPPFFLSTIIIMFSLIFGIMTFIQFYKITKKNKKLYSYILIPYILWLSFALYLSYDMYVLNKVSRVGPHDDPNDPRDSPDSAAAPPPAISRNSAAAPPAPPVPRDSPAPPVPPAPRAPPVPGDSPAPRAPRVDRDSYKVIQAKVEQLNDPNLSKEKLKTLLNDKEFIRGIPEHIIDDYK